MKKKVTPKGFDEASRTTRVKMYKSGKQWVQCLLTRLGMIKLSSGVKPEEVRVETNLDSKTTSLLKGVLAASALIGGGAVATPHAFAEVQTSTVDSGVDNNASQNLAEANTVSLGSNNDSTGAKSQTSDSASLSMSESGSQSTTESASDSKSDSRSTSQDTTSESASVSASESVANSQSAAASTSLSTSASLADSLALAKTATVDTQTWELDPATLQALEQLVANPFISLYKASDYSDAQTIRFSYTGLYGPFKSVTGEYDVAKKTIKWSVTIKEDGWRLFKFNPYVYLHIEVTNGEGNNLLTLNNQLDKILGEGDASTSVKYQFEGEGENKARIDRVFEIDNDNWSGGITYRTNEQAGWGFNWLYAMRSVTFKFETSFSGSSVTDLAEMRLYLETWGTGSLWGSADSKAFWSQVTGHEAIELYANGDQNHFDNTTSKAIDSASKSESQSKYNSQVESEKQSIVESLSVSMSQSESASTVAS